VRDCTDTSEGLRATKRLSLVLVQTAYLAFPERKPEELATGCGSRQGPQRPCDMGSTGPPRSNTMWGSSLDSQGRPRPAALVICCGCTRPFSHRPCPAAAPASCWEDPCGRSSPARAYLRADAHRHRPGGCGRRGYAERSMGICRA